MIIPGWSDVLALYSLQKAMMFTPYFVVEGVDKVFGQFFFFRF
jgi:hypothetical protein